MSEIKLISPLLDNFAIGDVISEHNGIRCCPAMEKDTQAKYIVKVLSVPPTQNQLDALLLSGAYPDREAALNYFKSIAADIVTEVKILNQLATSEGFLPIKGCQIAECEDASGFDVYLRSTYAITLQRQLKHGSLTHLSALNLGLDLCAALSAARHNGYLYINLKPGNIYVGNGNEYRIGDIGFIRLDSLRFASLPERYRSEYTAPEISDAYSDLNTTVDIYALGLILYQIFNDGILPVADETGVIPAPAYADYEIAEIIMKACAADPAERWQDPNEMGQALITYMQKNGAHDTPITPVPETEAAEAENLDIEADGAYVKTEESSEEQNESEEQGNTPATAEEPVDEPAAEITEDDIFTEDEEGNLTLIEETVDETMTESTPEEITYEEVTSEVSDILSQADDLIDHEAPGPVIQPEPIDVPMPETIVPDESETVAEEASDEKAETDASEDEASPVEAEKETAEDVAEEAPEAEAPEAEAEEVTEEAGESEEDADSDEESEEEPAGKSGKKWLAGILITLLVAAILAAGFFFVKEYYLQTVDAITLTPGDIGELNVQIKTEADEAELVAICTDIYGNRHTSAVENGKAFFEKLMPNSKYTINIETTGFHYLIGETSTSYVTPNTTEIVQFTAVTGSEDGSVILSFTISGPDSDNWNVTYTKDDGIKETVPFSGHIVTVTGLTPEKDYTFTLTPETELDIVGNNAITHKAKAIVKAEALYATACLDDKLTVKWRVAEGADVSGWTVRCYNDTFDNTVVVNEAEASFSIPDDTASYTVEVTAAGMSVSERVVIPANSTTVTDFAVAVEDNALHLSWSATKEVPADGWILSCNADGSPVKDITCNENSAVISPVVPDCTYHFVLKTADDEIVLGGVQDYQSTASEAFTGYSVTAEDMEFKMCLTPKNSNWDRYDLSKSDYTTEFSADQKASFLVRLKRAYDTSREAVETMFVIRDANNNIVSVSTTSSTWRNMWYRNYCELDIPAIPQAPGEYTIQVYFNSAIAYTGTFSIAE